MPRDRRSFSIRGETYDRFKILAEREGLSMSGLAERIIHEKLDALGVPVVTPEEHAKTVAAAKAEQAEKEPKEERVSVEDFPGPHFEF